MVNQIEFLSESSFNKTCTFSKGVSSIDACMLTNMEIKTPVILHSCIYVTARRTIKYISIKKLSLHTLEI